MNPLVNFVSPNHVYFLKGTIDMDLAVALWVVCLRTVSESGIIGKWDDAVKSIELRVNA